MRRTITVVCGLTLAVAGAVRMHREALRLAEARRAGEVTMYRARRALPAGKTVTPADVERVTNTREAMTLPEYRDVVRDQQVSVAGVSPLVRAVGEGRLLRLDDFGVRPRAPAPGHVFFPIRLDGQWVPAELAPAAHVALFAPADPRPGSPRGLLLRDAEVVEVDGGSTPDPKGVRRPGALTIEVSDEDARRLERIPRFRVALTAWPEDADRVNR